jgi:hypothetical protein
LTLLKQWVDLAQVLTHVLTLDPNANYAKYWAVSEDAGKLAHIPASAAQMDLVGRVQQAIDSCEVGKLDKKLVDARKRMDRAAMEELKIKAQEFNHTGALGGWQQRQAPG